MLDQRRLELRVRLVRGALEPALRLRERGLRRLYRVELNQRWVQVVDSIADGQARGELLVRVRVWRPEP